jgi:AcrR family transcriptional regulator
LTVAQLPRGRHGLARKQVIASQRGRMLDAMARAVAEHGYANTSVGDVIALAGVSRETFYEHFSDKAGCFLATLDASTALLLAALDDEAMRHSGDPLKRFERGLSAYLGALAAQPHAARTFLVEAFAAGPEAARRRFAAQDRFVERIAAHFGARSASDRFGIEMLVSAISSLVTRYVATDRTARIPELRAPILRLVRRLVKAAR